MIVRAVSIAMLLTLVSLVFGQIDPKAEPFLGFTNGVQNAPQKSDVSVRALDYTLCNTSYESADQKGETCIRTVIDVQNRRMLSEALVDGDESLAFRMVYKNGRAIMADPVSEKPLVLPKAQAAILKKSFDYIADLGDTGGVLPDKVLSATYDGTVKYGKVVRGEQVTATVLARSFMLGNTTPQKTTMRFIFGKQKQIIAFVTELPPRNMLFVLDNPADTVPMRRFISSKMYWLEDGKPKLSSSQRLTRYRLNPKLSDNLFTLEPKD